MLSLFHLFLHVFCNIEYSISCLTTNEAVSITSIIGNRASIAEIVFAFRKYRFFELTFTDGTHFRKTIFLFAARFAATVNLIVALLAIARTTTFLSML